MYISSISFYFIFFYFQTLGIHAICILRRKQTGLETGHVHEAVMIVLLVIALKWWLLKEPFVCSSE